MRREVIELQIHLQDVLTYDGRCLFKKNQFNAWYLPKWYISCKKKNKVIPHIDRGIHIVEVPSHGWQECGWVASWRTCLQSLNHTDPDLLAWPCWSWLWWIYYRLLTGPQGNMYKSVPCSIIWGYMKSEATWLPISETWIEKMWWMNAWKQ